jgi:hypothetical protein
MRRFASGKYQIQNPEKYVGNKQPTYRSSWEYTFMKTCDTHPAIVKWASEAISIPYRCPVTGRQTVYVPDFFIQYVDKNGAMHVELIEVKPRNQTMREHVGRNKNNQIEYARNLSKWQAAHAWCRKQGIKFRVINEQDLFSLTPRKG